MMRHRPSMLSTLAVVLSYVSTTGAVAIVPVDLHATRDTIQVRSESPGLDRKLLSIQVGCIVAAYVISIVFTLSLFFFVGRRLRREKQTSNYSLEMIMMHPAKEPVTTDPSPSSPLPGKGGFGMSLNSLGRSDRMTHASADDSVTSIDENVVESDRRRAQEQMEMLYAAVMEHDAQKAAGIPTVEEHHYPAPRSPLRSPRYAGYSNPPTEEPAPQSEERLSKKRSSSRLSRLSNLSIFSTNSRSSGPLSGKLRSPRISLRKLPISSPVGSPAGDASDAYAESQPLTPRIYTPGPPPPAPQFATSSKTPTQTNHARAPAPAPLNFSSHGATNSSSTLPFRQAFNPPQSAPATKTTILERPIHAGGPRTGVPTPYSPYMPFTPVTPVTPSRMVTRKERKRMEKENGLRVLNEDDMVKSDEEIWGV